MQDTVQHCQSIWTTFILTPISAKHYSFVSYTVLSIGLTCKLTWSHAPWTLMVGTCRGKITGKKRTLGANHGVC
jgi:hypothetical protein